MMTTTNRRIALLTGASAAALGISALAATPALAAPHDALADGIYPGTVTADPTVEICDLATPPGSPCFFGVIDTVGPVSIVTVDTFAEGQVNQFAPSPATMANNGSAEFGAIAVATNAAGAATATASIHDVVYQSDFGGAVDLLRLARWLAATS